MMFEVTYQHPDREPQKFTTEIPPGYQAVVIPIAAECMGIERLEIRRLTEKEETEKG